MSNNRYPEEFKIEAVRQITDKGYSVADVSRRLDVSVHSLYAWVKKYGPEAEKHAAQTEEQAELKRLRKELQRVTEERDILKKGRGVLREAVRLRYAFIKHHKDCWPIRKLCRLLDVHPSGYYAWRKEPCSRRQKRDIRQTGLIKQFWLESGGVYGYRKIHSDLCEYGERIGINRVHRLMKLSQLKAQVGYRKPRHRGGVSHIVTPNRLNRVFNTEQPNQAWVTDVTYIKTHEGWLYLAVVVDLFSRRVIGWSMQQRMTKELVLDALLMAIWRRKPKQKVVVHSDQGSQYTSHDWSSFLRSNNLEGSMSRRGNCHDNAVAESFFQLLKRERIKRKIYSNRAEARRDVFDYIEMFYNSKRRHSSNDQLSPVEYEKRFEKTATECLVN
ncbi:MULTISPECIES: IS3 family transposase [unclassified Idiomarina]|uniref:IS3 family transposase n=2 Tax=Idiomarina TaxID=135575 RepID=UPI000C611039|nr:MULTISPECIES: IS3 family transposase [unclassified Idiomarina]MBF38672.1 IS3 family transposase [Idiomarinaceae bacterium]